MKRPTTLHGVLFGCILSLSSFNLFGQSLTVTLVGDPDITGLSSEELLSFERSVTLNLANLGSGGDTLVVELGAESDSFDLFSRRFALNQTGTFEDGCSLTSSGGATVIGLGSYTGLDTFFVRSYLSSAGVGSASIVSND